MWEEWNASSAPVQFPGESLHDFKGHEITPFLAASTRDKSSPDISLQIKIFKGMSVQMTYIELTYLKRLHSFRVGCPDSFFYFSCILVLLTFLSLCFVNSLWNVRYKIYMLKIESEKHMHIGLHWPNLHFWGPNSSTILGVQSQESNSLQLGFNDHYSFLKMKAADFMCGSASGFTGWLWLRTDIFRPVPKSLRRLPDLNYKSLNLFLNLQVLSHPGLVLLKTKNQTNQGC